MKHGLRDWLFESITTIDAAAWNRLGYFWWTLPVCLLGSIVWSSLLWFSCLLRYMLLFIGLLIVASYIVYLFLLLGLGHLIVASFAFALVLSSCSRVFCLSSCSRFFCSAFDHPKLTKEWHVFGDTGEKGRGREGRGRSARTGYGSEAFR